jgi:hypothetical protein
VVSRPRNQLYRTREQIAISGSARLLRAIAAHPKAHHRRYLTGQLDLRPSGFGHGTDRDAFNQLTL